MSRQINGATPDDLVIAVFQRIRDGVETGDLSLSSESTFRFQFAWELGRLLGFSSEYRFDFEWLAYAGLDSDDTFLDLLVYTEPSFKVALEFKLPKASELHGSAQTQFRAYMCRDISRLCYLVRNHVDSVQLGYFLCATDEGSYLYEGRKHINPQYKTYHGTIYPPRTVLPKGKPPNGIERELRFPNHEVRFEWQGIEEVGMTVTRLRPTGRFAWLKPIKVWA